MPTIKTDTATDTVSTTPRKRRPRRRAEATRIVANLRHAFDEALALAASHAKTPERRASIARVRSGIASGKSTSSLEDLIVTIDALAVAFESEIPRTQRAALRLVLAEMATMTQGFEDLRTGVPLAPCIVTARPRGHRPLAVEFLDDDDLDFGELH